jgi:hypothetical protein
MSNHYPFHCDHCDTDYGCRSDVYTITVYCPVCKTEYHESRKKRDEIARQLPKRPEGENK